MANSLVSTCTTCGAQRHRCSVVPPHPTTTNPPLGSRAFSRDPIQWSKRSNRRTTTAPAWPSYVRRYARLGSTYARGTPQASNRRRAAPNGSEQNAVIADAREVRGDGGSARGALFFSTDLLHTDLWVGPACTAARPVALFDFDGMAAAAIELQQPRHARRPAGSSPLRGIEPLRVSE